MGARPGLSGLAPTAQPPAMHPRAEVGSHAARRHMIERLVGQGVRDEQVLEAMYGVAREEFIEPAFRGRAYQDVALPIGHEQTISKPSIVARMVELAAAPVPFPERAAARVLEIGTGCGYQAAVLSRVFGEVVSLERIGALHRFAQARLADVSGRRVRLVHGDGHLGLPGSAPFHAIVLAAALDGDIPEPLLHLLRPGARLVAPLQVGDSQRLICVDRTSLSDWQLCELDTVRFVPMLGGVT